ARLPLGRVQGDGMEAGRRVEAPYFDRRLWHWAGRTHWLARTGDVSRRADQARATAAAGGGGTCPRCDLWGGRRGAQGGTGGRGIDMGITAYVTDSDGHTLVYPRLISQAEARLKRYQRHLSRRSVYHKNRKKPRNNHTARRRARQNKYPAVPAFQSHAPTPNSPSNRSPQRQSANWVKAKQ